jgi:tape measure domain-containing protein
MARTIEAFKLRTEIAIDNAKASSSLKSTEKGVDSLGKRFTKLGPEIEKAFKGKDLGARFGQQFGASATSVITGSMDNLGQTLGSLLGTAIMPGLGTAIGSTVGSAIDKLGGPIMSTITAGIELNKILESTKVEFTSFTGSEKEAVKYLDELLTLSRQTGILPKNLIEASESLQDLTGNMKLNSLLLRASIDHAADIGGGPGKMREIADALGLIAEKGDLTSQSLKKLYKLKINAPELLAEATGLSKKEIEKLMAQGRIRGDVAARVIAQGLQRKNAGFAAKLASTTTQGAQDVYEAQKQILGAKGTENITQEFKKRLQQINAILGGPQAAQFVESINTASGSAIKMMEQGLTVGVNLGIGVAKGIESGTPGIINAVTNVGSSAIDALKKQWGMQSPSLVFAEMGAMAVEGLENGLADRTAQGFDRWAEALEKAGGDAFIRGVAGIAQRIGVKPEWLLNVMAFESGFNPKAANPNSPARGLIQFMNPTARRLGFKNSSQITQLSAMQQLPLVEQYYKPFAGKMRNQGDVYSAVAAGKLGGSSGVLFRAGSKEYAANKVWDVNRDGVITSVEIGKLAERKGGFTNSATIGVADVRGGASRVFGDPVGAAARVADVAARASQLALMANGRPITDTSPMPVSVVQGAIGVTSSATKISAAQAEGDPVKQSMAVAEAATQMAGSLPPVSAGAELVTSTATQAALSLPPLAVGLANVNDATVVMTETTVESAEDLIAVMISAGEAGDDMISRLGAAIGSIGGMMPQQEVGKKRGLFSKILGFAAPFLSFIPGAGPILSHLAGMGSAALAGNWGGVVTGLAGGLAPGGVFRGSGGGGGSGGGSPVGQPPPGSGGGLPPRARGGPVRRGRAYLVGEHRPEMFVPDTDGYVHPRVRSGSGGDTITAQLMASIDRQSAVLERQNSFLSRLEGIKANEMVRLGARGLITAYDQDASLIRLSSQRHRLP